MMKQQQQNVVLEDNLSNSASENISQDNGSNYNQSYFAHPPPSQSQNLPKKKRNLPGNPDPEAEVISLSPKTLMATNRFVCEMCNKGFQRDQNLQLHRRGHNLPWKLKQRNKNEVVRKKVYVCPEVNCVHHEPSRALGDLTGIKKHFCRKHGEKKWKCDKCSKKYAVQSDWKAHSKTCGTKEYKCDCGTLFSRRDSFITHRAFCDALAEESARAIDPATIPGQIIPSHFTDHFIDPTMVHTSFLKKEESPFPLWLQSQDELDCSPNPCPSPSTSGATLIAYHPPPSAYMSATALLQKAAQMGTTHLSNSSNNRSTSTTLNAPCTTSNSFIGPHHQQYLPHVSANSPAAGNNTCGTSGSSGLLQDSACAGGPSVVPLPLPLTLPLPHQPLSSSFIHPVNMSMMTMIMLNEDGFADVSTFDDAFGQLLDTKKEVDDDDDEDNNNNDNNGNGNLHESDHVMMHEKNIGMGMTRDFLGLKADPSSHGDHNNSNILSIDQTVVEPWHAK